MARVVEQEPQRLAAGEAVIPPDQGLQALAHLITSGYTQACVMPIDWNAYLGEQKVIPSFVAEFAASVTVQSARSSPQEARQQVRQVAGAAQQSLIQQHLQSLAARVLQMPSAEKLDPNLALVRQGLDSLMAIELRNQVDLALSVKVPLIRFLEGLSIAQIAAIIQEHLAMEEASPTTVMESGEASEGKTEWEEIEL